MKKKEEINLENAVVVHAQPCVLMHATRTTLSHAQTVMKMIKLDNSWFS